MELITNKILKEFLIKHGVFEEYLINLIAYLETCNKSCAKYVLGKINNKANRNAILDSSVIVNRKWEKLDVLYLHEVDKKMNKVIKEL